MSNFNKSKPTLAFLVTVTLLNIVIVTDQLVVQIKKQETERLPLGSFICRGVIKFKGKYAILCMKQPKKYI